MTTIAVNRWQRLAGILKENKEDISSTEEIVESQFATDPMKSIDTSWQSVGKDPDYEQVFSGELEQEPTMIGSVQDEEFNLDDFDSEEEGLTTREPDWEADPEYDEDGLGDLYGQSWEDAESQHEKDLYSHGRPVIRDTDIGRKS